VAWIIDRIVLFVFFFCLFSLGTIGFFPMSKNGFEVFTNVVDTITMAIYTIWFWANKQTTLDKCYSKPKLSTLKLLASIRYDNLSADILPIYYRRFRWA
jgi:hypothetical protein